jgi:hypothetical protein
MKQGEQEMANEQTMKLKFADDFKSPTLEIGQGDYVRKFDAKDQPFECSKEEAEMLLRTKHFVVVEPESAATPKKEASAKKGDAAKLQNTGKIGGAPATAE